MFEGPYTASMTNFTPCPGIGEEVFNVTTKWEKIDGKDRVILDANISKAVGPIGGIISVYKWLPVLNKYMEIVSVNKKNICENFVAGLDSSYWPKLDSRCYLEKGHQIVNISDGDRVCHMYSGSNMAYGKYKTVLLVKYGRKTIGCRIVYADMMPKE